MIPQIQPWINEEELEQLRRVVDSTYLTEHTLTREFEARTRELTGARHAVAMTNGTMALYCCLKALDIGPGDEVIVPDMTFIATSNAVIMAGATPVFCDILPDTFCIDVKRAEGVMTSHTKAIIPVHLYGQSADMDAVQTFAETHSLKVIEDAAQGVGVRFKGRHTGTFGKMGILSYYGNKTITCGEGGIVLTDDDDLARACYRLKNHGRDHKGIFIHEHIGFNFSFTEMQAAIGIAQMNKLPRIIERKKAIHDRYVAELADLERLEATAIDDRSQPVHWFTSFLSDDAEQLATYLQEQDIQTRRFFYPLHLQPCYRGLLEIQGDFAVTDSVYQRGISLPSSYLLTDEEQGKVIQAIRDFHREHRR